MNEITCPKCHTAFVVDQAGYADILRQVRDREFTKQLETQLALSQQDKENAVRIARAESEAEAARHAADQAVQIEKLEARIAAADVQQQLALASAAAELARDRDTLQAKLELAESTRAEALRVAKLESTSELERQRAEYDRRLAEVEARVKSIATEKELERVKAVADAEKSLAEARSQAAKDRDLHQQELRHRDGEIERLKDFKARLSTKMLGESLEQHCETAFNQLRSAAFPRAFFEKDNDSRTGSKGDYIFREKSEDEVEVVSIMFEMKNESDTTSTKKRNEDFLKELDKDRQEKGCEYAVLVSLLEADSELYNGGIVDVSHRYPKMYVVRPQFFIPIITLIRGAAQRSLQDRQELARIRAQNIDITNFEDKLARFKTEFERSFGLFGRQLESAVEEIDKTISHLQKTKDLLLKSAQNLGLANKKAQQVTIRRLTHMNPTMKAKFEEQRFASGEPPIDETEDVVDE
jgi:hypothetical protein